MALNITRGVVSKAQKIVVYGPEGIGKTTFASKFPDPLFIDTEGSTDHYDVARTEAPKSWAMLADQVREVARTRPCATLVIDTVDWAETLCISHVCAENKWKGIEDPGYGKGYTYLAEEFGKLLNLLSDVADAGINVVALAHAMMRKFEQPDEASAYDRWELKLQKKIAPMAKEWADAVLFANYRTIVEVVGDGKTAKGKARGGQKRVMHCQHHACWDAKNRWGLADEVPFDFAQIATFVPSAPLAKSAPAFRAPLAQAPAAAAPKPPAPMPTAPTAPERRPVPKPVQSITYAQDGTVVSDTAKAAGAGLPDYWAPALQLMEGIGATVDEIRTVSAAKGHHTPDTPAANYEKAYIDGCIVAQWAKWAEEIKALREQAEPIPF